MALAAVRSKAVVLLLLIVSPIVGFCNCSAVCCALLCNSSFAVILVGKRGLVSCVSHAFASIHCLPCGHLLGKG